MSFFQPVTASSLNRPAAKIAKPATAQAVFQGRIFTVYQWRQELYNGGIDTFESLKRADTVTILPVLANQQIVLTRQQQPRYQEFYGLPGGVIDPGEDAFSAAKRELAEETGYVSADWRVWFCTQLSHKIDWGMYVFVAKNCVPQYAQHLDGGEHIQVLTQSWPEFEETMRLENYRDHEIALRYFRLPTSARIDFVNELLQ